MFTRKGFFMDKKFNQIMTAFNKNGGRVTSQRKAVVSIIMENPGCSCKELYYLARRSQGNVSRATVYRVVRELEELGFVNPVYGVKVL